MAVTLVDVPLVRAATVARWSRPGGGPARRSSGRRSASGTGIPVIFDRATFAALRTAPLDVGAKAVIAAFRHQVLDLPTDDAGALRDVDTPDDYAALLDDRDPRSRCRRLGLRPVQHLDQPAAQRAGRGVTPPRGRRRLPRSPPSCRPSSAHDSLLAAVSVGASLGLSPAEPPLNGGVQVGFSRA